MGLARFKLATTRPVVGEMVRVESELETEVTAPLGELVAITRPVGSAARKVPAAVARPEIVWFVVVALLATSEDEYKFVEVELVVVAFRAVKFCKVVEPITRRSPLLLKVEVAVPPK